MSAETYEDFAARVLSRGLLGDPWCDGKPRLQRAPLVLRADFSASLNRVAEALARVVHEGCEIVAEHPELLESFFGLSPWQRTLWLASQPLWHGIARVDLFETDEGLVMSEINCDTPTGEAEAVELSAMAHAEVSSDLRFQRDDPNAELGWRFRRLVAFVAERELVSRPARPLTVGLVYPTEFTEDLSLVRAYKTWLEAEGHAVILGSPYNLAHDGEHATLFGAKLDVLVRHYKTDWWGERESVWRAEHLADNEPLTYALRAVLTAMSEGRLVVINPFGAVLAQNKRMMAFMWEHLHRFSIEAQGIIQRHVPVTARLETMHAEQLIAQREAWVIKSDYGAEGDEVIIGALVPDAQWQEALAEARPGRWIAQRYFQARTTETGATTNLGVFLIGGEACGIYARLQPAMTDHRAVSAGVLVMRSC